MSEIEIREATCRDAAGIASLLGELGYPNTADFVLKKLAALAQREENAVLVVEFKGRVVGFACLHLSELFHEEGRLGRIMAMAVMENSRRRGLGSKLMNAVEAIAREAGCVKMEVTSGARRRGAHAFYNKMGYVEEPKRFIKELR